MKDVLGPAHNAAFQGDGDSLRGLALANLMAVGAGGRTPAHYAAVEGHVSCLHALHELGAAASLSATDANGTTPAHLAAMEGHVSCLRALHELGAAATSLSATAANGRTPAHYAAMEGHA